MFKSAQLGFLTAIVASKVIKLTPDNFDSVVYQNDSQGKGVFVCFYASWCQHSQKVYPKWNEFDEQWGQHITLARYDCSADEQWPLCDALDIEAFPTMVWFPSSSDHHTTKGYPLTHSNNHEIKDWIMFSFYEGYRAQGRPPYHDDSNTDDKEIVDL